MTNNIAAVCYVAFGGAIGAVLRYLGVQAAMRMSPQFPAGTMAINILGSLLIGLAMAKLSPESGTARLFLVTGILGGFTTFSAFSWDTLQLAQRGQVGAAMFYVAGSVGLSLIAVILGFGLGR